MITKIRPVTVNDSLICGLICFNAFKSIAQQHNFPSEFPDLNNTQDLISRMVENEGFYGVVAEQNGKIIGSNFLDMRGTIAGLGPVSIDPGIQNSGIGRSLMQEVVKYGLSQNKAGIRLNTASHHGRSQSLYTKLGFRIQAPMMILQGPPIKAKLTSRHVRFAQNSDIEAMANLCKTVLGYDRVQEVRECILDGEALLVEQEGRITGYSTGVSFFGHSVGETNLDIKALITATSEYKGAGFLVPATNFELLNWCLEQGLKIVMGMNYMTMGLYDNPQGAYLPSVLY
jgi:GNAT superfamily N-acetyltransferase